MNIKDLLIDFDEMGFAPTALCPNPAEYACEWKIKLVAEINRQQAEIEKLKIENQSLRSAADERICTMKKIDNRTNKRW